MLAGLFLSSFDIRLKVIQRKLIMQALYPGAILLEAATLALEISSHPWPLQQRLVSDLAIINALY